MGLFGFGKKKKEKTEAAETAGKKDEGGFLGFVLLEKPVWDREQFVKDLLEDWEIDISGEAKSDNEEYKDIILAEVGDLLLTVSFMPGPVPNGEAEHYAAANYMWKDAVETTKRHTAQILVVIMGNGNALEKGKLFAKAAASCLKQPGALGIYTDGAVFEPDFYRQFSMMMKEDQLPIMNWVWFGIYQSKTQSGIYTYGMKKFGKDEMEVYVTPGSADLNNIRNFMLSMAGYVLEYDVELKDGETIGFSAEQKLPITKSRGIALDGETLKIEYGEK